MRRAGIRELRRNASVLIRRIVPLHGRSVLDQMITEGRATAARGDLLDLKPHPPLSGRRRLSDVLADLRADER